MWLSRYLLIIFVFFSGPSVAADSPLISIIIDDLGYRHQQDTRAVNLPGPVICAIMPHSPLAERLAQRAHRQGKEIILHLPMEPDLSHHGLGPGALTMAMHKEEFLETLRDNIKTVPLAIGINNHMGSRLTRHQLPMQWLMGELKKQGYAYIDSKTSKKSVATDVALENQVPFLARDVFLDNLRTPSYIQQQLQRLTAIAEKKGHAIAIGHPHPETLDALETYIQNSHHQGLRLVSLKEMIEHRQRMTADFRTVADKNRYQLSQQ